MAAVEPELAVLVDLRVRGDPGGVPAAGAEALAAGTRYPPRTTTACAVGAGVFATTLRGVSIQIARAASRGIRAEYVAKIAPWFTAHAVLASARPSSSITST